jgi:hypothetical protein
VTPVLEWLKFHFISPLLEAAMTDFKIMNIISNGNLNTNAYLAVPPVTTVEHGGNNFGPIEEASVWQLNEDDNSIVSIHCEVSSEFLPPIGSSHAVDMCHHVPANSTRLRVGLRLGPDLRPLTTATASPIHSHCCQVKPNTQYSVPNPQQPE